MILCPLKARAKTAGSRPAIFSSGRRPVSYARLDQWVMDTQWALISRGVKAGQRVAIIHPNSIEYIVLLLALWRQGAVACLIGHKTPPQTTLGLISRLDCDLIVSQRGGPKGRSRFIKLQDIVQRQKTSAPEKPADRPRLSLDQSATILFTSGSTGEPKAVVHSFANHYFNALGSNKNIRVGAGSRWLLCLPLCHVSGLSILFRCLLGGGGLVLTDDPTGRDETFLTSIQRHGVTHVSLVATQLYRLLRYKRGAAVLRKLQAILVGGGPTPAPLMQELKGLRLPVYLTYGLTETASQVATASAPMHRCSGAAALKILSHRQVKLAQDGEILVRGKILFQGYWRNGRIDPALRKDGWFGTGDLGSFDEKGRLIVAGRRDNMFTCGGENIQPEGIEQALNSLPYIEQALVLPQEDAEFGCLPVAFVKIRETAVNAALLRSRLKRSLPKFQIPRHFYAWPKGFMPVGIKPSRQIFLNLLRNNQKQLKKL